MTAMDVAFALVVALAWAAAARSEWRAQPAVLVLFVAAALATFYPNEGGILRYSVARVDVRDVALLAAVLLSVHALVRRERAGIPGAVPAAFFYCAVLASMTVAWLDGTVALVRALRDFRPLLFMSFAALVPAVLATRESLRLFVRALGWYAAIVLALLPVQMVLAARPVVFLPGFPASPGLVFLGGWSWASIAIGNAFVFVGLYRLLAGAPLRAGGLVTAVVVAGGAGIMFLGFARMNLISLVASCLVALVLVPWRVKLGLLGGIAAAGLLLAVALTVGVELAPGLIGRAEARLHMLVTTMLDPREYRSTSETGERTSIGRRLMENRLALGVLARNPILGAGLGYKYWQNVELYTAQGDWVSLRNIQVRGGTYIHNGWLWILSKTGLVGGLAFVCFMIPPFAIGLARMDRLPDVSDRALVFGLSIRSVALLVDGFGHPYFFTVAMAAGLGITAGIVMTTFQLAREGAADAAAVDRHPVLQRSAWDRLPLPSFAAGAGARSDHGTG